MSKELNPEAQAWKRQFAMLYLLKDDFSFQVTNSKPPAGIDKKSDLYRRLKAFHDLNVKNH